MEEQNIKKTYYVEPDLQKIGASEDYQFFFQEAAPNTVAAKAHLHNGLELIYVSEGYFTASVNRDVYELSAGELLLIRSRAIHRLIASNNPHNSYYVLKFDPSLLYNFSGSSSYFKYILPFTLYDDSRKFVWSKSEVEQCDLKQILSSIISEGAAASYAKEVAIKIECAKLLLYVLRDWNKNEKTAFSPSDDNTARLIYKSVEFIRLNFSQPITAQDCCRYVGLSYSYFSRLFKQVIGKSFKEYLNYVRCNYAQKLLGTTDKSIADIATECGYSDSCYFIYKFRETRGVSPSKFRRSYFNGV